MSYKYKNICTVQRKFSPKETMITHETIQKYIDTYLSIILTYAIYTTFKWMSHFLDNKYLSTE
jgi:hypothetical protein